MKELIERLELELSELDIKIGNLTAALHVPNFSEKVGDYQFELLGVQHSSMTAYRRVLNLRIKDLKSK